MGASPIYRRGGEAVCFRRELSFSTESQWSKEEKEHSSCLQLNPHWGSPWLGNAFVFLKEGGVIYGGVEAHRRILYLLSGLVWVASRSVVGSMLRKRQEIVVERAKGGA
mmetsp:Transcript_40747/g.95623  ORF Transcript_40747/g.95623 Transcript_40747/m.95623 type:complete len:109 (-) Transcript_40747:793-1119(-)